MQELSLHLLDLVQNSITAGAALIEVSLTKRGDWLTMEIRDDGKGMDSETAKAAQSPFHTSRTTRKVGLGIPLTEDSAKATGGNLRLTSEPGKGTTVTAVFNTGHIDCLPLGKADETLAMLIISNPSQPDFIIHLRSETGSDTMDTREIKQALGGIPLNNPDVAAFLFENLKTSVKHILGGITP